MYSRRRDDRLGMKVGLAKERVAPGVRAPRSRFLLFLACSALCACACPRPWPPAPACAPVLASLLRPPGQRPGAWPSLLSRVPACPRPALATCLSCLPISSLPACLPGHACLCLPAWPCLVSCALPGAIVPALGLAPAYACHRVTPPSSGQPACERSPHLPASSRSVHARQPACNRVLAQLS
jgi:hypothetical protein